MIREWLETYKPGSPQEAKDALREIMQEIALAGLYRSDFFEKAAFTAGPHYEYFMALTDTPSTSILVC